MRAFCECPCRFFGLVALVGILGGAVGFAQRGGAVSDVDALALQRLIPQAEHFELFEAKSRHFRAFGKSLDGGVPELVGLAFFTTDLTPRVYAYKGRITTLVALEPTGRLIGIEVIYHYEPFGYFSIDLSRFPAQFVGKSILDPLEVGEDIDAISRATITMEAATRAIRQGARQLAREFLSEAGR